MLPHETITAVINSAKEAKGIALIPFITAGYPDKENFVETLSLISQVGDVVEIGVPFSDPMADGMTIQRSSYKAIQAGVTLQWIFEQLNLIKDRISAPLVMMSYLNPLLAFGFDALAERAVETGVCAFIVPDLPLEESIELSTSLDRKGIGLIQLVTPITPKKRLIRLCKSSKGFVYAVTITGITGGDHGHSDDLISYLDRVMTVSEIPVCAGFGIRTAEDVNAIKQHATGAIVGSALVEVLERDDDPEEFLRSIRIT